MIRLRAFLRLLAARGGGEVRACEVAAALDADGAEVRSALRAHGILRGGPRATTVPCDGLGCAREVRELPSASEREGDGVTRRLFFGVCTREPVECETVDLTELDIAQETISRDAFVAAVQRALRLVPRLEAETVVSSGGSLVSSGGSLRPGVGAAAALLGEETTLGERRDVVLAWRPESPVVRALLAEAEVAGRRMRVVTLDSLADLLTVRDGQIAAAPRLELVAAPRIPPDETRPSPAAPEPANAPSASEAPPPLRRSRALDGYPAFRRWGEVTLFDVDDDALIGIAHEGLLRRLSCIDLGLATLDGRRPRDVFTLLKTVCAGNGIFTTRSFGSRDNGKRLVSELRGALRETFGIASDPFERYSFKLHCWKPKFRALAAAPKVVEAATRAFEKTER